MDGLYSGDNFKLTFAARASWRLFLSRTLKRRGRQGQLATAVGQAILPGEQPHSLRPFALEEQ